MALAFEYALLLLRNKLEVPKVYLGADFPLLDVLVQYAPLEPSPQVGKRMEFWGSVLLSHLMPFTVKAPPVTMPEEGPLTVLPSRMVCISSSVGILQSDPR